MSFLNALITTHRKSLTYVSGMFALIASHFWGDAVGVQVGIAVKAVFDAVILVATGFLLERIPNAPTEELKTKIKEEAKVEIVKEEKKAEKAEKEKS